MQNKRKMVSTTTPRKKEQTRPNDPKMGSKRMSKKKVPTKSNNLGFETTSEKKDQTKPHDPKSSRKEEQKGPNENNRMKTSQTKTATRLKGLSATAVLNPIIHTPSTNSCPYPTMISMPYTRPIPVITTISPYIPPMMTGYPYSKPNWPPISMQLPSPVYSLRIPALPVTMINSPISLRPVCPYTSVISNTRIPVSPYHGLSPMCPPNLPCYQYQRVFSYQRSPAKAHSSPRKPERSPEVVPVKKYPKQNTSDPGSYLRLPKELFPNAKVLALDPNPVINELCLENNIDSHSPWILDIEFGLPKVPATRPIAIYDVQYNSIHCKNTPGAIHPAFEASSQDFKRLLLFYYDCIISSWYKGYIIMNEDISVVNFQSWLQTPMQLFGMCWP